MLTIQSATLTGGSCDTAGSGGPFTTAPVISGTTPPGGVIAGCYYLYKLTGTDRVGNTASIATTLNSTSSSGLAQGTSSKDVLINGTGFISGAVVSFSGPGINDQLDDFQ